MENSTELNETDIDYTTGMITRLYVAVIFAVHTPLWILNVGGNSLVIISVYRERSLRRPTYVLISALAVADIFLPLFAYPPSMYAILVENKYTCSAGTRTHFFFLTYMCAVASFFHIIAITFERYIGVVHPLHYHRLITQRRIAVMVGGMWTTSFAIAFLSHPIWRDVEDPDRPVCRLPESSSIFSFAVFCLCMAGVIALSLVYLHIYVIARRHWRLMHDQRKKSIAFREGAKKLNADENDNDHDDDDADDSVDAHGQLKATKTIGIIVAFFVICYVPMAMRYLFEGIHDSITLRRRTWILIKRCSETFGLLNGAINPLVYARQNSTFRRAFKDIFKALFDKFTLLRTRRLDPPSKGPLAIMLKARPSLSTDLML